MPPRRRVQGLLQRGAAGAGCTCAAIFPADRCEPRGRNLARKSLCLSCGCLRGWRRRALDLKKGLASCPVVEC